MNTRDKVPALLATSLVAESQLPGRAKLIEFPRMSVIALNGLRAKFVLLISCFTSIAIAQQSSYPVPPSPSGRTQSATITTSGNMARPPASSWRPSRPVHIVVPFTPAGLTDVVARALAQELSASLGGQFIVDNKPGAYGMIGADAVAKSAPDGHVLLIATNTVLTAAPHLFGGAPFDPETSFAPISQIASTPLVLVVNPSSGYANPRDLVSRGGTLATPGAGTLPHLAVEMFGRAVGGAITYVHYRGAGPAVASVIDGTAAGMFLDPAAAFSQIKAGNLRTIAVTGSARSASLPNVPTFQELGISEMELSSWLGVWAPAGTSPEAINRYYAELSKISRSSQFRNRLGELGYAAVDRPPADLAQVVRTESAKLGNVIRAANERHGTPGVSLAQEENSRARAVEEEKRKLEEGQETRRQAASQSAAIAGTARDISNTTQDPRTSVGNSGGVSGTCDACESRVAPAMSECKGGSQSGCFRAAAAMCQCYLDAGGCGAPAVALQQCVAMNNASAASLGSNNPVFSSTPTPRVPQGPATAIRPTPPRPYDPLDNVPCTKGGHKPVPNAGC